MAAATQPTIKKTFSKGLLVENPVLRLVLGTCPALAISTSAPNGIRMGIEATLVLIASNIMISTLRKVIPDKVRIPAYIIIIAGFVSIIQMLVQAFFPALNESLGIFLPLIVVNCVILGRAEAFANKNTVLLSAVDGLGMGLGFTAALLAMSIFRELLGSGTLAGIQILPEAISPLAIMVLPPGGFFAYGILMAIANKLSKRAGLREATLNNCAGCALAGECAINDPVRTKEYNS